MKRTSMAARMVWACTVAVAVAGAGSAFGGTVGFEEDFALSADRAATLSQLIPGTDDFYYYTALNQQNQAKLDDADTTIKAWVKQLGRTQRAQEMENRQALLKYPKAGKESLDYLKRVLNLQFNHEKETLARQAALPTELDPALISRETLAKRALANNPQTLAGFEDSALGWLAEGGGQLSDERLHELLSRLIRPDLDGLAKLVARDLGTKFGSGFGSLNVHRQMLLAQLDELLKLKPELLNDSNFVMTYMSKLWPAAGVDVVHDTKERQAYLDRLWAFVSKLSPQHNSLKANVLYQRLVFDRKQGTREKDRFMEYLKLPRPVWYVNPKYLEQPERRNYQVNLSADYRAATMLLPIMNEEPLVRSYLLHLLADAQNFDDYKPYIENVYLSEIFAEAKILSGIGDQDKWAAMLPAAKLQALKERVELEFAYTNQEIFAPDDKVSVAVNVKNVKTLIVKVYQVNAANYYKTYHREVNTDINLDGLVANEERTIEYTDSPLRLIEHKFDFEKLTGRGVYVIEFIGNGKSSRALVRKGKLRYLERDGAAGQIFTVLDEANKQVADARLWMAGHEYTADKDGEIQVPYSTNPQASEPIVLQTGDFASLDTFALKAEAYRLDAGIHVARESLIRYATANVVIRPALFLNDVLVSPKLLDEVTLVITSTDMDGISSSKEVPNFKLFEDQQSTYEFNVPDRLKAVTFTLKAKVQNVSLNKKEDVAQSRTFTVNEIDTTDKIEDLHLSKIGGPPAQYVIDVLGKTGEDRAGRPVNVSFKARDFKEQVHVTLKTDAAGRVKLGTLEGIETLFAKGPEGVMRIWHPTPDMRTDVAAVQGAVGDVLHVPYMGTAAGVGHDAFSLLELRDGGTFVSDKLDALTVKDGFLEIKGLAAGDYDLLIKQRDDQERKEFAIRIAPGPVQDGWVLSPTRFLEIKNSAPLQIASVTADANNVTIQLANAGKLTRVHVFATRFVPEFSPFGDEAVRPPAVQMRGLAPQETVYESGRDIGDEYRYIIDRKYAAKYPGNMLARPGLLLNPWAVRPTDTGQHEAQKGGVYHGMPSANMPALSEAVPSTFLGSAGGEGRGGSSDDLDFLAEPAAVMLNLQPDDKGVITIPRTKLGDHQEIQVLAVDAYNTVYREISLQQPEQKVRDLRMATSLDPTKHFTEQKQISVLAKGETLELPLVSGSNLESFDTIGKAYRLYATLHPDATLAEFSFILNWPTMKDDQKREKYSKYACHELNFFLSRKDPDFFNAVIKPYLKNKMNKTFMDHYLLGDDLGGYTTPWAYGQLNAVEQVLLGQRIADQQAKVGRHIKDGFDLIPPNIDRYNFLFNTALGLSSLSKGGSGTLFVEEALPASSPAAVGGGFGGVGGLAPAGPTGGGAGGDVFAYRRAGAQGAPQAAEVDALSKAQAQQHTGERSLAQDASKKLDNGKVGAAREKLAINGLASELRAGDQPAFADKDLNDRKNMEQMLLYRQPDKTMELAENNYYHLPIGSQVADLVHINAFWNDYAQMKPSTPFLSKNLAEPAGSFTEIMFALSVLDLPFDEPAHVTKRDAGTFTLTAGGPVIAFHKQIKEAQPAAGQTPILVSQNYFRYDDRYTFVDNERTDKYAAPTDEFLTHVVYGTQVVITNPTSTPQKLDALLQLPKGAMPVLNAQYSRGLHLDLQPYETKAIEYAFYFPAIGEFPHYPVQVAKNEKLVASVAPSTLKVVATPSKVDTTSWDYISQNGSGDDVIAYLKANNIERVNLEKIAWRMKDKPFFGQIMGLLRDRHVYQNTLWSYSILQDDPENIREFLQHQDQFASQCGEYLDSPLLKIDPVVRHTYEHLEYLPLINARAHRLGQTRQVLNERFFEQYERELSVLRYHPALTDEDKMAATYYLLLQDRVEDGLKMFGSVNSKNLPEQLQYDYFTAYADFYQQNAAAARDLAEKYKSYPVDRWKNLFTQVAAQADEIEGKAPAVVDKLNREEQQNALAAAQPTFDLRVEDKKVILNYKNLPQVKVNYYLMDIELMFSQNPFLQEYGGQFSMIMPNETAVLDLDPAKPSLTVPLPDKFLTQNVMVEIVGGGQTRSKAYYANSLGIQLAENYGQLTVTSEKTSKPLAKAYVKVYLRTNDGHPRFYKDGYTDLRGKFDYASLSTNELDNAAEFSLLILTDTDGATVRTATPPKR